MTRNGSPNTSRMTIRKYLDEVYVPDKRRTVGLSEETATFYREAVRQLESFTGRQPRCVEINDLMLERLTVWMIERGLKHYTAKSRIHALKGILRHWRPEKFPKITHMAKPTFIDADIEGTLDYVATMFYFPERTRIASPRTIQHYGRVLRYFGEFLERVPAPADLTDNNVGQFLRWFINVRKVKPVTANGYVKQLKALWVWLAKKHMVADFPTVDKLVEPEVTPIGWTKAELQKLMTACRDQAGDICGVRANLWWTAYHLVLWDTGERTGAMFELRWAWLDWQTGYLCVPGEFRKGRNKSMVYPLKKETLDALRLIRSPQRSRIFRFSPAAEELRPDHYKFYKHYRRLVESAGLPYVKFKTGPQKMRRTFASHIEAAGGNATRALKHTDRRVTEESYLDPRIVEQHHENEKLFSLGVVR